jgi:NAD-reducing hydrogenase large subunit
MPGITARICGICPISHILASAKAGDAILTVRVPETAVLLRRLMNLGQMIQSHALSFFYLSAPDILLGWDADPAERNVIGLFQAQPDLVRKGVRLRAYGQEIIHRLGGKRIHPAWAVPGGVNQALSAEDRQWIKGGLPEAFDTVREALDALKTNFSSSEWRDCLGEFPSMFFGLVSGDNTGTWEHYDGLLRLRGFDGTNIVDGLAPSSYADVVTEASEAWSYLKFPFYGPMGYPQGMYRVGPLGRVNICDQFGTPRADEELAEFRERCGGLSGKVFDYHYTRLLEILASLERVERILQDDRLVSDRIRAEAGINSNEGVGVHEAPRGTLIHHYKVDDNGLIEWVNLIVSTGHNNLAMNESILRIARQNIRGGTVSQGILNQIEGGIRAFDPCLSCSVHAIGHMPLQVTIRDSAGQVLQTLSRSE